MKRIILASQSPRRRELLGHLTKNFEIIPAQGEEYFDPAWIPSRVVCELSNQKAHEIAEKEGREDGVLIIAADTVVALDDKILGKPADEEEAFSMINDFQGRDHKVFTGVTIIMTGKDGFETTFAEETAVHVVSLDEAQIRAYIAKGESMDKAGAYGIQGAFGIYIDRISGDYNNVVGFPIARIHQELLGRGVDLTLV